MALCFFPRFPPVFPRCSFSPLFSSFPRLAAPQRPAVPANFPHLFTRSFASSHRFSRLSGRSSSSSSSPHASFIRSVVEFQRLVNSPASLTEKIKKILLIGGAFVSVCGATVFVFACLPFLGLFFVWRSALGISRLAGHLVAPRGGKFLQTKQQTFSFIQSRVAAAILPLFPIAVERFLVSRLPLTGSLEKFLAAQLFPTVTQFLANTPLFPASDLNSAALKLEILEYSLSCDGVVCPGEVALQVLLDRRAVGEFFIQFSLTNKLGLEFPVENPSALFLSACSIQVDRLIYRDQFGNQIRQTNKQEKENVKEAKFTEI